MAAAGSSPAAPLTIRQTRPELNCAGQVLQPGPRGHERLEARPSGRAGYRHDNASLEVEQARTHDRRRIHARYRAQVDSLTRVELRLNDPGAHDLDAYAALTQLDREQLREGDQERLACRVDGAARKVWPFPSSAEGEQRSDIDDCAPSTLDHTADGRSRQEHRREHVEFHERTGCLEWELGEVHVVGESGVVDEEVDFHLRRLGAERRELVDVREICLAWARDDAVLSLQPTGEAPETVAAARDQHEIPAVRGKLHRIRFADPRRGTCDEREPSHVLYFPPSRRPSRPAKTYGAELRIATRISAATGWRFSPGPTG